MSTASIVTVRRRNRFQTTALARRTAPSQSHWMQSFLQSMVGPAQETTALAPVGILPALFRRTPQQLAMRNQAQQLAVANHVQAPAAPPVEQATYVPDPPRPQVRTKHSSLLTFFD